VLDLSLMALPVAILAGGLATRLRPATELVPKSLLEVAGKPFAVHQVELLRQKGLRDLVFCVGHMGEQIEHALGDGTEFDVHIHYSDDGPTLLGTGGALRRALPRLGEAFFVMYGDSYLDCDFDAVEQEFRRSAKLGLMTVFRNRGAWDRSNVKFVDGQIIRYDKVSRSAEMEYIDWGLGVLRAEAFSAYPADEPFDLAGLYQDLLARHELAAVEVTQRFFEIGSPEGLAETSEYLRKRMSE
jgi:N-acetyl-alpha-D-muramate 1-phosphate uridylyltransferase